MSNVIRSKSFVLNLPTSGAPIALDMELLPNNDWAIAERSIGKVPGKTRQAVQQQIASITNEEMRVPVGNQMASKSTENATLQEVQSATKIKIGENKNPSNCYPLLTAVLVWQKFAENGCTRSAALLAALAVEVLELRADRMASIERSQDERDDRFVSSLDMAKSILIAAGIEKLSVRRKLKAAYELIAKQHRELLDRDRKMVYLEDFLRFLDSETLEQIEPLMDLPNVLMVKPSGDGILFAVESVDQFIARKEKEAGRVLTMAELEPFPDRTGAFSALFS